MFKKTLFLVGKLFIDQPPYNTTAKNRKVVTTMHRQNTLLIYDIRLKTYKHAMLFWII